jgi:hypothetical protein
MRRLLIPTAAAALTALAATPTLSQPAKADWYAKAVKSVEATFDPAEAKPGQTVTLKVTVTLTPGHYTYATTQADKQAADLGLVNAFTFPKPGAVVFVGEVTDPKDPKTKAMPELGVKKLKYYDGKVTFERKAVVRPTQGPGPVTVKVPEFKLNVCTEKDCFPVKKLTPEAPLKVLDGPAVPVDPKYADEVKKALGGV